MRATPGISGLRSVVRGIAGSVGKGGFRYLPKIIIRSTWERFEPWVTGIRASYNDPMFGGMFEYFYNETMRLYPDIQHPRFEDNPEGPTLRKVQ